MLNVLFVKENVLTVSIISLIIGEMEKVVVTFWEMKNSVFRFLKGYTTNTIRTHFDTKFAPRWKNHKRFPVEIKSFMGFCFRSARGRGHCHPLLVRENGVPSAGGLCVTAAVTSVRSFLPALGPHC